MTTFDALEVSEQSSKPIEIYRFLLGTTEFLYTSHSRDVTRDSIAYEAIPIKRSRIVVGQSERKRVMEVTVPWTNVFAQRYIGVPPGQRAELVVSRLQRDEVPTFDTKIDLWQGNVLGVRFGDNGEAVLGCQSLEGVAGRNMPRYSFAGMCNHTLFGPGCDVPQAPHTFTLSVSAVSGRTITVDGLAATGRDFTGGFVRPAGIPDPRLVLKQSGNVLTLLIPFEQNVVGSLIDCSAGCDHLINGDCALVYNNVAQNGGFAWVPNQNVFARGIL